MTRSDTTILQQVTSYLQDVTSTGFGVLLPYRNTTTSDESGYEPIQIAAQKQHPCNTTYSQAMH